MRVEINMQFIHKYYKNMSCVILAETARGWKVRQTETFTNSKKKQKITTQYYDRIWFDSQKGQWDKVNN